MNKKISVLIAFVIFLIGIVGFVSAGYYADKNQGALIISKGWNLVPYVSEVLDDSSNLQLKDAKYIYIPLWKWMLENE